MCSFSQSRTYGNEQALRNESVKSVQCQFWLRVEFGLLRNRSFSLICLIFNNVTSWFRVSRSQNRIKAALLHLKSSYWTTKKSSSRSHNSILAYVSAATEVAKAFLIFIYISNTHAGGAPKERKSINNGGESY
jgi:hypothetical protein